MGEKYKGRRFSSLTPSERGYITRLSKELKSVIQNPANFVVREVKSAATRAELKAQGYKVVNNRAIIKSDFDGQVKIESRKDKKTGKRTVHVKIINKFEEKTTYKLKIQDLIKSGEIPLWIHSVQADFGPRDSWAISIAGKPIGDFFQDIETLMDYFESYLEVTLGEVDAAKCVLMRIKSLVKTVTDTERKPRGKEIKEANKTAKSINKFRR